ncbi:MAG: UbiA prenyltransferase family protein [Saprospirales bacterium]|nr:UbiA prenyltransferase family protein [Saprospirales bacterium]
MIALIGLFMHYFGFLLNDYFDFKFDKDVLSKKNTPLISGKINKNTILVSVFIFFILTLYLLYFLHASILSFLIILCSFSFSVVYNAFSKNSTLNKFIPEVSLALSISLLCIAITFIGNYKIETMFIIWVLLVFLILLQLNSVSNGLKDIKTDQLNGAVTFVIQNKCTYTDYNKLYVSKKVKYYTYALQILITAFNLFLFTSFPFQNGLQ